MDYWGAKGYVGSPLSNYWGGGGGGGGGGGALPIGLRGSPKFMKPMSIQVQIPK